MSELQDLYQELILDHSRAPRNARLPDQSNRRAEGHNPLCGDRLIIKLQLDQGVVQDIGFESSGCAISTAAASTMTDAVKGKPIAEIQKIFDAFHALVTTGDKGADLDALGKLAAFSGVSEFPMRVKCATLAWHTLLAALQAQNTSVSTE